MQRLAAIFIALSGTALTHGSMAYAAPSGALNTGNDLYEICSDTGAFSRGQCAGFVKGVHDGIYVDHAIAKADVAFCTRSSVTVGQLVAIVLKYMDDDPSIRDQSAAAIVEFALVKAFPCGPK